MAKSHIILIFLKKSAVTIGKTSSIPPLPLWERVPKAGEGDGCGSKLYDYQ